MSYRSSVCFMEHDESYNCDIIEKKHIFFWSLRMAKKRENAHTTGWVWYMYHKIAKNAPKMVYTNEDEAEIPSTMKIG